MKRLLLWNHVIHTDDRVTGLLRLQVATTGKPDS